MESNATPFSVWQEQLERNGIECSLGTNTLKAKLESRDEEGHHYLNLSIYTTKDQKIVASISGMGDQKHGLEPDDAVQTFIAEKFAFFSN
jgi:hypothetical protein